jgi:hypothetical protein
MSRREGEKGSGGMGIVGGVSRNLLWACDKIRSGRLIERRSGDADAGGR